MFRSCSWLCCGVKKFVDIVIFNECYIEAIAGPFYNIMKVMMKGPNKQLNTKKEGGKSESAQF